MQQAIGGQDRRQRDPGQIHALGQHLGSHQHIRLPGGKAVEQSPVSLPAPGGVAVKAQQPQAFKFARQLLHHPLGAGAKRLEGRGSTVLAAVVDGCTEVTPVTAQPLLFPAVAVHGEGHVAMGAHHRLAAAAAAQKCPVPPPRHQDHGLVPLGLELLQPAHQGAADQASVAFRQFMAHVDHPNCRQGARTNALR